MPSGPKEPAGIGLGNSAAVEAHIQAAGRGAGIATEYEAEDQACKVAAADTGTVDTVAGPVGADGSVAAGSSRDKYSRRTLAEAAVVGLARHLEREELPAGKGNLAEERGGWVPVGGRCFGTNDWSVGIGSGGP